MIFKITTITGAADTAVVATMDMHDFVHTTITATTMTASYAGGNVVALKTIGFTVNGTNAAEKQLNADRLQTWWSELQAKTPSSHSMVSGGVYVMNLASIVADAGLTFTGATTSPLTGTVVGL